MWCVESFAAHIRSLPYASWYEIVGLTSFVCPQINHEIQAVGCTMAVDASGISQPVYIVKYELSVLAASRFTGMDCPSLSTPNQHELLTT